MKSFFFFSYTIFVFTGNLTTNGIPYSMLKMIFSNDEFWNIWLDKYTSLCLSYLPEEHTTGPSALAKAPTLRRIPITVPFWLAEPRGKPEKTLLNQILNFNF